MSGIALLASAVLASGSPQPAAAAAPRYRGVVTAVGSDRMTIRTQARRAVDLRITPATQFAFVVPARLDAIRTGSYLGAAVTGAPNAMTAVEVALIPADMRRGRVAYYDWDPLPDPSARSTRTPVSSPDARSRFGAAAPTRLIPTRMTNALVSRASIGPGGSAVVVSHGDGHREFHMTIPAAAPVVRYVLANRAALTIGAMVMVKTGPGDVAGLVTIGRGVRPPM